MKMVSMLSEMKDKKKEIAKISGSYLKSIKIDKKEYWNRDQTSNSF